MSSTLHYEVFIADPIPLAGADKTPNGHPREFSPLSITLIYGERDAVLVDPPLTRGQSAAVSDWVAATGRNLTDIFVTHGHGDHWFGASGIADRFGARVVATEATIEQMHANLAARAYYWDAALPGQIPDTDVTATTAGDGIIELEGDALRIVEVGHTDSEDTSVLHVPTLDLVVAGDAIYNGVHQFLREAGDGGIDKWLAAIDIVADLRPRLIVAGHKDRTLDDDAQRTITETRDYLRQARDQLNDQVDANGFFTAMLKRFPDRLNPGALWGSATALYL